MTKRRNLIKQKVGDSRVIHHCRFCGEDVIRKVSEPVPLICPFCREPAAFETSKEDEK